MSGWVSKINSNLDTPETLLLDPWCSASVKSKGNSYELFGIVMHSGMTSCSGHYQAYVKVILDDITVYSQFSLRRTSSVPASVVKEVSSI